MRKITHLSKTAIKLLPACVLAVMSLPAYSAIKIDQPGVKNGLQFYFFSRIYPKISTTSDKFTYVLADPSIYRANRTLEQVLADQDRQDSDKRARLSGTDSFWTHMIARQVLNKDWSVGGNILLIYTPTSNRNLGANWGLSFYHQKGLGVTVGKSYTDLRLNQTFINLSDTETLTEDVLANDGTNLELSYEGIPNLRVKAYHMLARSSNTDDRREFGWHKHNGVSAEYDFHFAPRNVLKVKAGTVWGKSHQNPWYVDDAIKSNAYAGSIAYHYGKAELALDYGKKHDKFNGGWWDELDTTVYGAKVGYNITPRLKTAVIYAHKEIDNSKPMDLAYLKQIETNKEDIGERQAFRKTKKDTYRFETTYDVWNNIEVIGSVEHSKTRNFIVEGEFSKREQLTTSVGARFTF